MIFEVLSVVSMAGMSAWAYTAQKSDAKNDHEKIIKIANAAGLKKNDEKLRIYRRYHNKEKNYTEYVYKMPLGLSLKQFEDKKDLFIDGLNNKSKYDFRCTWDDLKQIKINKHVVKNVRKAVLKRTALNKHIELSYDGMLKFRVYDKGLERMYVYNDALLEKTKGWQIPIGYTHEKLVLHDFEKLQMLVVAGMTRYGKTVALKNMITTLIHNKPDDVEFTLIDLKGGLAFNRFKDCKQVLRVAKNADETVNALEKIHKDLLARQKLFLEKGWEDIGEAGYTKRHFIIIDEGAEIAGFTDKEQSDRCTHLIGEIARIGAGLSYRVIFATQYPTADVFPRTVKSNTSASLCFRLKNATQSSVVLDKGGAEELPAGLYGRAIYQSDTDRIVQTPFIENKFIDEKIKIHIQVKSKGDGNDESGTNSTVDGERRTDSFNIEAL